ncbi:tRNA-uridine aminocarboxypropyltransferase [uncultured Oxalicibacterium sp.]|uniref:tRNA-uridine aminocarboxypropyltransferase n=1 Tax=uncultured Oxalicibacterium sp. TaxID=1168540 RepID=UPI0025E4511F|nr:tRNA-uridine aminocarboxypropyltransferase [uncultured Oxalicibacterium sp.]
MSENDATPRRALCVQCERPQSACICHWIMPTGNTIDILILQHPLETGHAKGTGLLLHRSLQHSSLAIGEEFDAETLQSLLHGPCDKLAEHSSGKPITALLYPEDAATYTNGDAGSHENHLKPDRLVVLDATWRKSRKMLYLNPLLAALPRVALKDITSSRYHIRKAHRDDQLSTFEATCHALAQLEGDTNRYVPMLQAFDGFVAQQQTYRQQHALGSPTSEYKP